MLNLILGGAGCGKTHLITEMIKKDVSLGQRAILLVPEQETVARERAMLEQLSPSAQLTFEVMNFTRLANSVFRKYGGLTYNYVSAPLKALAMWNTLRQLSPLLKEYGGQSEDVEFSAMMLSQIEEFKAYGISPTALERAADKAQEKTKTKAKLEDMSLIYAAYSAALASFGAGDASDDIAKLAEKLREHDFFQNTNVYIDSFTSFTASEEQVLLQIMRTANSVSIALCIPCEGEKSGLQFECVAGTLGRIERLAEKCACPIERTVLRENRRTKNNALLYLSENIWSFNSDVFDEACEGIELIKCTNTYEEAEAACTAISKLVREGMRYRDIVVLARNIKSYEGIIDSALEKADIPYFISKTDDVTSMPLSKLLLSALRIKNSLWRTEDIITYIKTGLTGIDERAADLFEQYIWKWSISGAAFLGDDWTMDPDSYSPETSEKNREILRKINEARFALIAPLKRLFEKIDAAVTNRDICRGIFEYMEELSIAQKLRNFAERCRVEGNPAMASENLQLYNSVLDVLSILAEFDMGEERFNSADLEVALRIVLARTGLGVIPTSCDEVSIGSASLMRADSPRCVILIGVNDGVFPENVEENRMLSDEEKQFLALYGIELSGGKEERSSEELFYVYRAISAPSERLIMTYAASELQGGKEIRPSLAFERTKLLLGLNETDYSLIPLSERIWSERVGFEYTALADGVLSVALQKYFSESEAYRDRLNALYIPICDRECFVPPTMADTVFGRQMYFSPSALEKYVKCHFDYWCEYVLRLRRDEKNVFKLSDTGSLIHALLEEFVNALTDENGFNAERAEDEGEELLEELMQKYIAENFREKDATRASFVHVIKKLAHLSGLVAKSITNEMKKSRFKPSFFELRIGERGEKTVKPLRFELSDGSAASLGGIVDRVDLLNDGDDVYVKVVDYKTGSKDFSPEEIREGLNLQMLLYLFSICRNERNKALFGCGEKGKLKGAGIVYLSSKFPPIMKMSGKGEEQIAEEAEKSIMRSGMLLSDEKVLSAIREDMDFRYILSNAKSEKSRKKYLKSEEEFEEVYQTVAATLTELFERIRYGDACIDPREDGRAMTCDYCGMGAVCRRAHVKKKEEGGEDNG